MHKFYKGNKDSKDEFNFPLKILIHNINVPLIVILNFFVTSDTIELNKYFLNFEKTFTDEANKLGLTLQNKSLLPQKYGFLMKYALNAWNFKERQGNFLVLR